MQGTIKAPSDKEDWPKWRKHLKAWRNFTLELLDYDGSYYDLPEFEWNTSAFSCYFLPVFEQSFYEVNQGEYKILAILEQGAKEFGGFDSILLWPSYPRLGLDERNQFDFYRDLPGEVEALRDLIRCYHDQIPFSIPTVRGLREIHKGERSERKRPKEEAATAFTGRV